MQKINKKKWDEVDILSQNQNWISSLLLYVTLPFYMLALCIQSSGSLVNPPNKNKENTVSSKLPTFLKRVNEYMIFCFVHTLQK